MPELPEVETIKNDLRPRLAGRGFVSVYLNWPRLVLSPSAEELCRRLPGLRIEDVDRRAKYLILHLTGSQALVFHLMMTGTLLLRPPSASPDPFTQAVFSLDDGSQLHFCDRRKLGTVRLVEGEATIFARLGPEPLEPAFTVEALTQRLTKRQAPIKATLCDQTFVAGLGNIYSDEALHRARIHPLRKASSLSSSEAVALHQAIREVLKSGIQNRGTTFSTFRDPSGNPGRNRQALLVYRRRGEPCPSCGTPVVRIEVRKRGCYLCPRCQPSLGL